MILQQKSLEKLRLLINEETEYRSGRELIKFFKTLGFNDSYNQGFPSRWIYTDEILSRINGKPELDKCIKNIFAPVNFIGRFDELDAHIKDFNQYLAFDNWQVVRDGKDIQFKKAGKISFESTKKNDDDNEDLFLNKEFGELKIEPLGLGEKMSLVIKHRIWEMKNCLKGKSPLAMIFLCGSTFEGILLDLACKHPREFNTAKASPKDSNGKVLPITKWSLNSLIDVSCELSFIGEDVKKFSHALRGFRNYIHPNQQVLSKFNPDHHTAKICWQVFQALIADLSNR